MSDENKSQPTKKTACDHCHKPFTKTFTYRGKKGEYCSSDCLDDAEPTGPRPKKEKDKVADKKAAKKKVSKSEAEEPEEDDVEETEEDEESEEISEIDEDNSPEDEEEPETDDEEEDVEDKKKPVKSKKPAKEAKAKKSDKTKKTAKKSEKADDKPKKKAKPEGSGLDLPFKAGSAMGRAFMLAMKGTTEKEINALAKECEVKPSRLVNGIQLEAYLGKKWTCKVTGDKYKITYPLSK